MDRKQQQILRLAALFQMTAVGAPMVYYGTEVGMVGADDPDDRMPMLWEDLASENQTNKPSRQQGGRVDRDLLAYYRSVIALRHDYAAFRRGTFTILTTNDHHQLIAYARQYGNEKMIVLLNRSPSTRTIKISFTESVLADIQSLTPVFASNSKLESTRTKKAKDAWVLGVPPRTGAVWKAIVP
jgi:glycosidase